MSDFEDLGDVDEFEKPAPRLPDEVRGLIRDFIADKLVDVTSDACMYALQLGEVREYLEDTGVDLEDDETVINTLEEITMDLIQEIASGEEG